MDNNYVEFLLNNGHILMLMTKKDTIEAALAQMVSSSACADEFRNFFGIDPFDYYWEYNLLPEGEPRNTIDKATKARYNNIIYCQRRQVKK